MSRRPAPKTGSKTRPPPTSKLEAGKRHRGIGKDQQERDSVDAGNGRYLDDREGPVLRIAQKIPGKAGQQEGPEIFQDHPEGGGPEKIRETSSSGESGNPVSKNADVQGEVQGKRNEEKNAEGKGEPSVRDHGMNDPRNTHEVKDHAGNDPQRSTLEGGHSVESHQKRDEGPKGERG